MIILIIVLVGIIEKKPIFDLFIKGAIKGIEITLKIFPTLIGLFFAIGLLNNSGIIEFVTTLLSPVLKIMRFPKEIVPLVILRPISGSASMAIATNIIEQNGESYYLWIIDYSQSPLILKAVSTSNEEGQCDMTTLMLDGEGEKLNYYSINGAPKSLRRELTVSYMSLTWDKESLAYTQTFQTETVYDFSSSIQVPSPLCNTDFTVTGDQILNYWGLSQTASTEEYITSAIGATATAEQTYREEATNEDDRHPTDYLGGSAPAEIEFKAYVTDAVTHIEWEFSDKEDFSNTIARYNDETLWYTFRDEGVTYVRLVASNSTATCQAYSETFTINIGEPRLEAPNVFSPGTSPGVNDEWKVAYKSIVSFKCWIFNKWGVQMFYFDSPDQGWDGKYRGKYVDPGVYYYVIEAKGANNKKMKLKGHINILRPKN